MIDTLEGHASLAMAGDCLAWKIRAATSEQLAVRQPALGAAADCSYIAHSVQLALRERLILVADNPHHRPPKLAATIAATFAHLDAETHRRMLATDAVTLLRRHYEQSPRPRRQASLPCGDARFLAPARTASDRAVRGVVDLQSRMTIGN